VELRSSGWGDPTAGLDERAVDVAFVWLPVDVAAIETAVLVTERRFVAVSARHPLAGRQSVAFSEIINEPFAALPVSAGSLRALHQGYLVVRKEGHPR
jgi:DNA-binding transcriptional LysR family regulator